MSFHSDIEPDFDVVLTKEELSSVYKQQPDKFRRKKFVTPRERRIAKDWYWWHNLKLWHVTRDA